MYLVFVVALFTNTGEIMHNGIFTDIKVEPKKKKSLKEMLNQSNTKVRCIKSYVDIEESSSISSLLICVFLFLFLFVLFIVWEFYLFILFVSLTTWLSSNWT